MSTTGEAGPAHVEVLAARAFPAAEAIVDVGADRLVPVAVVRVVDRVLAKRSGISTFGCVSRNVPEPRSSVKICVPAPTRHDERRLRAEDEEAAGELVDARLQEGSRARAVVLQRRQHGEAPCRSRRWPRCWRSRRGDRPRRAAAPWRRAGAGHPSPPRRRRRRGRSAAPRRCGRWRGRRSPSARRCRRACRLQRPKDPASAPCPRRSAICEATAASAITVAATASRAGRPLAQPPK